MMHPLIGYTTWERTSSNPKDLEPTKATLDKLYSDGVLNAGGVPFLLPDLNEEQAASALAGLDGLILSGGGDVSPETYSEENTSSKWLHLERDHSELRLVKQAVALGVPIFGICRGMQVLNVAFGGTLLQEVQTDGEPHPWSKGVPAAQMLARRHTVVITPGTHLERIYGSAEVVVNSLHHQAVDAVAPEFVVSAVATDGTIEGMESADGSGAVVAVQWHPEKILDEGGDLLFQDFVQRVTSAA